MTSLTNEIQEKYPFLSLVTYGGLEYIGIIQNSDEVVLSMYNFDLIKSEDDKIEYLKLGESWWWESNQKIGVSFILR